MGAALAVQWLHGASRQQTGAALHVHGSSKSNSTYNSGLFTGFMLVPHNLIAPTEK